MFGLIKKIGSGIKKGLGTVAGVGAKVLRIFEDKSIGVQVSGAGTTVSVKPAKQILDVPVTEARAFPAITNYLPYILIGVLGWFVIKKIR